MCNSHVAKQIIELNALMMYAKIVIFVKVLFFDTGNV